MKNQKAHQSIRSVAGVRNDVYHASTVIGGAVGLVGYIVVALVFEFREPLTGQGPTYGQQAGYISLPQCAITGAMIGYAFALSCARRFLASICLLLFTWILGSGVTAFLRMSGINLYGRQPSDAVLYYAPLAFSTLALILVLPVGIAAFLFRDTSISRP